MEEKKDYRGFALGVSLEGESNASAHFYVFNADFRERCGFSRQSTAMGDFDLTCIVSEEVVIKRLRKARVKAQVSEETAAATLGITIAEFEDLERNRGALQYEMINKLTKLYGITDQSLVMPLYTELKAIMPK